MVLSGKKLNDFELIINTINIDKNKKMKFNDLF